MGDTNKTRVLESSEVVRIERESGSLPNGNEDEQIKEAEPEISKNENETTKKENIESTESEDSEKVEPPEYLRKLRSRSSRTTRSSRSSSIEFKFKEIPTVSSKDSAYGDSKSDDGIINSAANTSDEEEFFGFDMPITSRRDAFLKILGKETKQEYDPMKQQGISDSNNEENSKNVESENTTTGGEINSKPSTTQVKSSKKISTVNIGDPRYKKPFEHGWMRELVYRSSGDSALKRSADVYYFTPNGKKLRSVKEVLSNMTEGLTIENFTFLKEPIGVGDKEIVREAKLKGGKIPEDVLRKRIALKSVKSTANKQIKSNNNTTSETATNKSSLTPKVVFKSSQATSKNKSPITTKPKSETKKKKSDTEDSEAGGEESDWGSNSDQKTNPTRIVCSIECRLAMGLIPTLQCHLCLCLYHPECVGLQEEKLKPSRPYICKNCQVLKKQANNQSQPQTTPTTASSVPKVPSPPKKDVKIISVPRTQSIVGALTTWLPHSSSIQVSSGGSGSTSTNNNNSNNTHSSNTTNSVTVSPSNSSTINKVQSSSVGPISSVSSSGNNSNISLTNNTSFDSIPQSLLTLNNRTFIFVPKHNVVNVSNQSGTCNQPQVSVAVTGGTTNINNSTNSTGLTTISTTTEQQTTGLTNLVATAPGTFVVSTNSPQVNPHGLFLVPFPFQHQLTTTTATATTTTATEQQQAAAIINNSIQAVTPYTPGSQPLTSAQANGVKRIGDSPTEGSSPPPEKKTKRKREFPQETMPSFLMNLNVGFTVLLHAFQFLKVHELLRASCVSKAFEMIAHHDSLWSTVRMKNSMVRDWNGFGKALRLRSTKALDLRKMLLPETADSIADMWIELGKAITNLPSLTRIDLGRCTPQAVEIVSNACPQLESLVTLAVRGIELDLSHCAKCTNLTELKIKSIGGIDLKHISELKNLKLLRHLALTTIKNLNGIEQVLPESLESLELGECTNLPDSIATDALIKLKNLKRLRLEKGQGNCPTTLLLQTVSKLSNLVQLELINFDIKPGFDIAIGNCTNLKTLLIIPTYVTQSATTNHVVMGGVSKLSQSLTYFIWGLTLELLRVTDLFIDQVEGNKNGNSNSNTSGKHGQQSRKPGTGDSIPILKPLTESSSSSSAAAAAAAIGITSNTLSGTSSSLATSSSSTNSGNNNDIGGTEEVSDILGKETNRDDKNTSQVDILALPKLQKVLSTLLPNTKIKILKVPFSATWRQIVTDSPTALN